MDGGCVVNVNVTHFSPPKKKSPVIFLGFACLVKKIQTSSANGGEFIGDESHGIRKKSAKNHQLNKQKLFFEFNNLTSGGSENTFGEKTTMLKHLNCWGRIFFHQFSLGAFCCEKSLGKYTQVVLGKKPMVEFLGKTDCGKKTWEMFFSF